MKYPKLESREMLELKKPKCGAYAESSDAEYYTWIWGGADAQEKTLAAAIMDTADDIAYAVHDFEDGVWAGMIPLYELLAANEHVTDLLEAKVLANDEDGLFSGRAFSAALEEFTESPDLDYLRNIGYDRTREARAELKNLTARIIGELIDAVSGDGRFVEPEGEVARRIAILKGMAWQWMIERSDTETFQYGQRRLVARLFEGYWDRPEMLPRREEWEAMKEAANGDSSGSQTEDCAGKARLICDHIAGMTDGYARQVYDQMYRGTQRRDLRLTY
jgi:dGTPase